MLDEEKRKKTSIDDTILLQASTSVGSGGMSLKDARAMRKMAKQANNQNSMTGLPVGRV